MKKLRILLGALAIVGIVLSAFQSASDWALGFALALIVIFAWAQAVRLTRARKLRKFQAQDLAVALARGSVARFAAGADFSHSVSDTKFHEAALLDLRVKLSAPFFESVETDLYLVHRPLDRLRANAVQVYAHELAIGWLELDEQLELIELLDSVDGIAQVKGRVTFGLKAESHSVVLSLQKPLSLQE